MYYELDMGSHKKYLLVSTLMAMILTNAVIIYSLVEIFRSVGYSSGLEYCQHMGSFALFANSQAVFTVVYLCLLLNGKIRFQQLNNLLK